jgi:hypothetical protein
MTRKEVQTVQENRLENETFNDTRDRLVKEGKLVPLNVPPENKEPRDEEGFVETDISIPRWRIIQPTCRIENATPGTFRNTLTGEERQELANVTFLKRQNGRILFPKDDYSGEVECWSYDGVVPATDAIISKTGQQPKAECCVTNNNRLKTPICPLAMWQGGAPKCKETISFIGVDDGISPFFISLHGTAIPVTKKLISTLYLKKKQAAAQGKCLRMRDFRITITLKQQITERGKFFIPIFDHLQEICDPEKQRILQKCFDSLNKRS